MLLQHCTDNDPDVLTYVWLCMVAEDRQEGRLGKRLEAWALKKSDYDEWADDMLIYVSTCNGNSSSGIAPHRPDCSACSIHHLQSW